MRQEKNKPNFFAMGIEFLVVSHTSTDMLPEFWSKVPHAIYSNGAGLSHGKHLY